MKERKPLSPPLPSSSLPLSPARACAFVRGGGDFSSSLLPSLIREKCFSTFSYPLSRRKNFRREKTAPLSSLPLFLRVRFSFRLVLSLSSLSCIASLLLATERGTSPLSLFSLSLYFFPPLPFPLCFSLASNRPPLLLLLLPSLLSLFHFPKFSFLSLSRAMNFSSVVRWIPLPLMHFSCDGNSPIAFRFSLPNRRVTSPPPLSLALALISASFQRKPPLMREEREKR